MTHSWPLGGEEGSGAVFPERPRPDRLQRALVTQQRPYRPAGWSEDGDCYREATNGASVSRAAGALWPSVASQKVTVSPQSDLPPAAPKRPDLAESGMAASGR